MPDQPSPASRAQKVEEIAARYLDLRRAGVELYPQALAAAYPDLAPDLEQRLSQVEDAHRTRGGVEPPTTTTPPIVIRDDTPTTTKDTADSGRLQISPMSTTVPVPPPSAEPTEVGPYKILEPLGEGGMGSVYLAEQTEPVRRRVALKLIKWGMDTREVIGRFEAERQALALMDHPNIARVFDAGATDSGRPYFVMELVRGEPLTDYCDRQKMETGGRLKLFQQVCDAIQHAHQKGIIHRDLKPSNILVTTPGDKPLVKVIDFGIAKSTQQHLTERTLFTEQGRLVGTPEYMSPEQAEGTAHDIDTRTDIYSLGVILYRLLVGTLPFESKELRSKGYEEVRRIIREEEPRRPSTRLSTLGKDSDRVAKARKTDPTTLGRMLRGDLDWITMKALEKDRTRRYGTASELAADIQRHLDHDPVLAGPPGAGYRLRKLLRKYRGRVAAAAVFLALLLAGLATSLTLYVRAERAKRSEEEQREIAEAAREEAVLEAERLQASFNFVKEMLTPDLPEKGGYEVRVADILDRAAGRIEEEFGDHPHLEGAMRETIGRAYRSLGLYDKAEPLLRAALEHYLDEHGGLEEETTRQATRVLAEVLRHREETGGSVRLFEKLLAASREELGDDHPETLEAMALLARAYIQGEDIAKAEPLIQEALERADEGGEDVTSPRYHALHHAQNHLLGEQGRWDEAESHLRRILEASEDSPGDDHSTIQCLRSTLATALVQQEKYREAEGLLRTAVPHFRSEFGPDHPRTLRAAHDLGKTLLAVGKVKEALPVLEKNLEDRRRVLGEQDPWTLQSLGEYARALRRAGRHEDALPLFEALAEGYRSTEGFAHDNTLNAMSSLAMIHGMMGNLEEAEKHFGRIVRECGDVAPGHPKVLEAEMHCGTILYQKGRVDEALPILRENLEKTRRFLGDEDEVTIGAMINMGRILSETGEAEEAEPISRLAYETAARVRGPRHFNTLETLIMYADVLALRGKNAEAARLMEEAWRTLLETRGDRDPLTMDAEARLAAIRLFLGENEAVDETLRDLLDRWRRSYRPEFPRLIGGMVLLARCLEKHDRSSDAEPILRESVRLARKAFGLRGDPTWVILERLGDCLDRQEKHREAEALYREWTESSIQTFGEDSLKTAQMLHRLGLQIERQGRHEEAEKELLRAHESLARTLGPDDPRVGEVVQSLVDLYTAWDKPEKTEEYRALLGGSE